MSQGIVEGLCERIKVVELSEDFEKLLDSPFGVSECVCLGESTHGTQEFYLLRSKLTKYMIRSKGQFEIMQVFEFC
jgi:erythromycin esterase-like protein